MALPAAAQTAPASANQSQNSNDQVQKLEQYVVTGTNIPTAADALAVPIVVIGPQQIQNSGVSTNVLDVLRKSMPMFNGNGNIGSENATINSGTTYGGASLALHNLNTLILINGRRVAFDPAVGQGGAEFVDLNMIPVSAIERIEVLPDGASAIYGSDAVGGVVNVILKKNYNGWEVNTHWGESTNQGHYTERSASITGGVSNGTTSILISGQFTKNDPIYMKDRAYTNPIYGTTYYPGIIDVYDLATNHDQRYMLNPSLNAPPGGGNYTIDQLVANGTYTPISASQALHGFNLANYQTLTTNYNQKSLVVNVEHKIFGDSLTGFGDAIYSNVQNYSSLNGQPLYPFVSTPYLDGMWLGYTPPNIATDEYMFASNPNNPFSTAWMNQASDNASGKVVTIHNRFFTLPRLYQNDSTLFRVVGGLRGKINDNYSWEAAANLNRYKLDYANPGLIDTVNFANAIASGAINPFARVQTPGVLPGNVVGSAFINMLSTLNSFDFRLNGTPFDLPAGKLAFAVGASYDRESLGAQPDTLSIPDKNGNIGWAGATSLQPFNAHRKVDAFYAEVKVPVTAPSQNIPGLNKVDLDVAGRYENYTQVGASKVPQVSLRYQPIDDQLVLHASAGKSFAAPILYDLYGPISTGFTQSLTFNNYDNTGKATGVQTQQVQFQSVSGSNPNLKPSTATTWTAGVVYSPKQVKGLSISFDYYQTVQKQLVGSYDQQVVAQSVEQFGTASPYASTVHFGTATGPGITKPGQLSTANPSGVYLVLPLVNLASQAIKGWDATIEYKFDIPSAGNLDLTSVLSGYNSYLSQALPTENYYQYAGHASGGGSISQGTLPRWRAYTTAEWKFQGVDAVVAYSYIPSVTDIGPGGSGAFAPVSVGSYQQWDLQLGYDFNSLTDNKWLSNLSLRVGVNNVFNKMPPLAVNAFPDTNVDVSTYDGAIGRMYFVEAKYKF